MNECITRLNEELDVLLYFGSSNKGVELPSKPGKGKHVSKLSSAVCCIFDNLQAYPNKKCL